MHSIEEKQIYTAMWCDIHGVSNTHWNNLDSLQEEIPVRLLVNFSENSLYEKQGTAAVTIGFLNGDGSFVFAGWDLTHDQFVNGSGTVLGWLPLE